ncbi:manganese superoxide dismutase [Salix suchowensis]|nr:manganese superoxide dismutase [Salix suchowensis]
MPESMRKNRNASTNLRRSGVWSLELVDVVSAADRRRPGSLTQKKLFPRGLGASQRDNFDDEWPPFSHLKMHTTSCCFLTSFTGVGTRSIHRRRPFRTQSRRPRKLSAASGIEGCRRGLPGGALERLNEQIASESFEGPEAPLNELRPGTDLAGKRISDIVIQTAAYRPQALIFNYASLALNNSFFLDQLVRFTVTTMNRTTDVLAETTTKTPHRTHEGEISNALLNRIRDDWGSFPNFVDTFVNAASGMSSRDSYGSSATRAATQLYSHTWLGHAPDSLALVYQPGPRSDRGESMQQEWDGADDFDAPTPAPVQKSMPPGVFPRRLYLARVARHLRRLPTSRSRGTCTPRPQWPTPRRTTTLHIRLASKVELINVGEKLLPLFCVSLHEHAWLSAGYGVWARSSG